MNFEPFIISIKLAVWTASILFVVVLPIAYFLAFSNFKSKVVLESMLMLPIVLPPTVLGFYYLSFLGPNSSIGQFFENSFGFTFAFSFEGILIGSIIYCLPFMLTPITNGFRAIPKNMIQSATLLGKSKRIILTKVLLPNIKSSIWNAVLLTFAHTIGQFGLILMIGGKMEETNVASVAIYDEMNALNYDTANIYALIMLGISFISILTLNIISRNQRTIA